MTVLSISYTLLMIAFIRYSFTLNYLPDSGLMLSPPPLLFLTFDRVVPFGTTTLTKSSSVRLQVSCPPPPTNSPHDHFLASSLATRPTPKVTGAMIQCSTACMPRGTCTLTRRCFLFSRYHPLPSPLWHLSPLVTCMYLGRQGNRCTPIIYICA